VLRQLSIRTEASLLASHPATGRRCQRLSGLPHVEAAVIVGPDEATRVETELAPFAEALRKDLADAHGY
jgi:hypothetical protein